MELMGYGLALLAGITWGTLGITSYYLKLTGIGVFEVAFLRLFFAFLAMFIFFSIKNREVLKISQTGIKHSALIGLISQGLTSLALYKCISMTSTTVGVIMVCLGPLFTAILSKIIFKEEFTFFKGLALSLAFYGCFLVVTGGDVRILNTNSLGLGVGLISGIAYGFFPILSKRVPVECNTLGILMYSFLVGSIFMVPFTNFGVLLTFLSWKLLLLAVILGFVPTVLSYGFYSASIRYVTPTKAGIVSLVEIPVTAIIGNFFLGEYLENINVIGIAVLLCGTIISKAEFPAMRKKTALS